MECLSLELSDLLVKVTRRKFVSEIFPYENQPGMRVSQNARTMKSKFNHKYGPQERLTQQ